MFLDLDFQYTLDQRKKINDLRGLIEASRNLMVGTEDVLMTKFLNYANWQVGNAYECIKRYYDFKFKNPDWVAQHPVEYFRDHFYWTLSKFVMPKPDKHGRVLIVFKTVDAFDRFPNYLNDLIEMDDLIFESLLLLPIVQQNGITVIYDLSGTSKKFMRLLSPSFSRLINLKNDVLPISSRTLHLIQKGFLMNATASLVMPFMSKEFKDRTYTHDGKNFDKLRDMIGYDSLPAEYGGPVENVLDVNVIYSHLLRNADYLQKLQSYKKLSDMRKLKP